jgi:hypothetical protein
MTTWNPADKDADITLSNSNFTASITNPQTGSIRSTTSKTSGKWYLEYVANWNNVICNCGIMQAGAGLTGATGFDSLGWGIQSNGNWFTVNNSSPTNIGGTGADGDVLGFCLDLNANKFYLTKNGASLLGNPVAGTGGTTIAAATWFAGCGSAPASGKTGVMTANFGGNSLSFQPPSGFSAWDPPAGYVSVSTNEAAIKRTFRTVGV